MNELLFGQTGSGVLQTMAWLVAALGIVAFGLATFLFVYHVVSSRRRQRRRRQVQQATAFLGPRLLDRDKLPEHVTTCRQNHGDWATGVVLRESRCELAGDAAERLARQLVAMGEVDRLQRELRSRHAWKRARACRALGEIGAPEAREALLVASRDNDAEVRRSARDGLLADGSDVAIGRAIESYLDDVRVAGPWKRSFYARLAATGRRPLRELVASGKLPAAEEKLALEAIGDARDPEAVALVRERLASPDPELRATAARAAGKLDDQGARAALTGLLADPHWFVRAAAAKAFESVQADPRVIQELRRCLHDDAWWVRTNAAHALVCQGEKGAGPLLDVADHDEDRYARDAALAALGHGLLSPQDRQRLETLLPRLLAEPGTESLRPLLRAIPGG
jgi:hypothetical protein